MRKASGPHQVSIYELTPLGASTANLAVTLKVACSRVVDPDLTLSAELRFNGEPFALEVNRGRVDIVARPAVAPQVVLETDCESMVDVTDGLITPRDIASRQTIASTEPLAVQRLLALLSAAIQHIAADAPTANEARPEAAVRRKGRPKRNRRTREQR